jgi:hypothetical protein
MPIFNRRHQVRHRKIPLGLDTLRTIVGRKNGRHRTTRKHRPDGLGTPPKQRAPG